MQTTAHFPPEVLAHRHRAAQARERSHRLTAFAGFELEVHGRDSREEAWSLTCTSGRELEEALAEFVAVEGAEIVGGRIEPLPDEQAGPILRRARWVRASVRARGLGDELVEGDGFVYVNRYGLLVLRNRWVYRVGLCR